MMRCGTWLRSWCPRRGGWPRPGTSGSRTGCWMPAGRWSSRWRRTLRSFRRRDARWRRSGPTAWTCCGGGGFLAAASVAWDKATTAEARDFARWMQVADKPARVHWRHRDGGGPAAGAGQDKPAAGLQFVTTVTSISDGTTLLATIDWEAAITALDAGKLPCGG